MVFDLPESVAAGLVASKGSGYSVYSEPATPEPVLEVTKPTPRKRGRPKKNVG